MPRSISKGPFLDGHLNEKIQAAIVAADAAIDEAVAKDGSVGALVHQAHEQLTRAASRLRLVEAQAKAGVKKGK